MAALVNQVNQLKQKADKRGGNAKPKRKQRKARSEYAAAAEFQSVASREPRISRGKNSCIIAQEEFIGNVTGAVAFTAFQFAVNPGLAATFPWLAVQAQGWERYRFRRLSFHYTTATGSTTPGIVLLAPDYDASDAIPSSEQVAMSYRDRNFDVAWCKKFSVHCRESNLNGAMKEHFIRHTGLAANQDIKMYDSLTLNVCSVGGTAVAWGKLWVDYEVEFFNPQIRAGGSGIVLGGSITGATTMTAANPMGVAPVVEADSLGISIDAASGVAFANVGTYLMALNAGGTTLTTWLATPAAGAAVNAVANNVVNAAATFNTMVYRVIITVPGSIVTVTTGAATVTSSYVVIGSCPASSL